MEQKIKIVPFSEMGVISFLRNEISCIEEFKQNEKTDKANIYLKSGMSVTIENEQGKYVSYADCIFNSNSPNLDIYVGTARVKRAERTLSFQL